MADLSRDIELVPAARVHPQLLYRYWHDMIEADTLKYRLCDTEDPGWEDVKSMIANNTPSFNVYDKSRMSLTADFMFANFSGRAAQIHMSMHPGNDTRYSLELARTVTDHILEKWERNDGGNYLDSIVGLTPTTNRAACIFVQKVGFRKVAVIPSGIEDRGRIVDAMMTIKTRGEIIDGRKRW